MLVRNCRFQGSGCCLNGEGCTDFEVAKLYLAVGAGPEVDLDLGPNGGREVELEGDLAIGGSRWVNSKAIGREVIDRKVLHSYISQELPSATTGALTNACG